MSKGNLVRGEGTNLWSFLELLDSQGVTPGDLENFRKSSSWQQMITASVLKGDAYLLKLLALEVPLKKVGFSAQDIGSLAGAEDQLRNFREVLRGNAEIKPFDFWRVKEDLAIPVPALKPPTLKELQKRFPGMEFKSIELNTAPTEAVTLRLGTVLKPNEEEMVNGSEYERRLASRRNLILGYQQATWLVEHQDEYPAFRALLGKIYIDFPGLVVAGEVVSRRFPCLRELSGRWDLLWYWLGRGLGRSGRVASK